jgi:hypothetical protein
VGVVLVVWVEVVQVALVVAEMVLELHLLLELQEQ